MDSYNNNKATPTKRTGSKNENNNKFQNATTESDNDSNFIISPEIMQPNPTSATPIIPAEMPARETK